MSKSELTKNQKRFLEALVEQRGFITKAADQCNIHRTLHYKWMADERFSLYREEFEWIQEQNLDDVENALRDLIDDKDTAATIFYLKTKGKKRGFVERQELTGRDGEAIEVKSFAELARDAEKIK